jgi:hypothetical protein
MLSFLSTNVAYADNPSAAPNWQHWGSARGSETYNAYWFKPSGSWNRLAMYPDVIPQAQGISNAVGNSDDAVKAWSAS